MPGDKLEDNEGGGGRGELGQRFYSWKQPLPQGARGPQGTPPPGAGRPLPACLQCSQRPGSSYKRHAVPSDPKCISFCKR